MGTKQQHLEEIRAALGLSKTEMAVLLGIDQSYYQHILKGNGKGNLRLEHLESLLAKANVNPLWVLTGQGEMFMGKSHDFTAQNEPTEEQIETLFRMVLDLEGTTIGVHQSYKLKLACAQCFIDFPDARNFEELAFAARVYLKLLERLPQVDIITALGFKNDDSLNNGK